MIDQTTLTFLLIALALIIIASGYIGHLLGVTEGREASHEALIQCKKKVMKQRKEIRRLWKIIYRKKET